MRVQYALASECTQKPRWKRWEYVYDGAWENVRYELETKLLRTSRRHMWSYFSAMHYADWERARKFEPGLSLRGHTRLRGGDSVVLFRKPFPNALKSKSPNVSARGVHIPPHFRISLDGCTTEEAKLAAIMSQNMNVFAKKNELKHPSEYTYDGVTPRPPADYTCNGCDAVAKHFRADCEIACEAEGVVHRSLDKVRRPHGIPKSQLRRVEKGERGDAMQDAAGNYVVRAPKPKAAARLVEPAPEKPAAKAAVEKAVEVDWMMADQFCVSRRARYLPTRFDEPGPALPLEIENTLAQLDAQRLGKEAEFYAQHPSKRRKRNSTCTHWMRGLCVKGPLECEFVHNAGPEYMPVCKFYYNGECSNEDVCIFRHVERVVPKKPCPDYVRGMCAKGGACALAHLKRGEPYFSDWTACGFSREEYNHTLAYI